MKAILITFYSLITLMAQQSCGLKSNEEGNQTKTTSAAVVAHRRRGNRDSSEESSGENDSGEKADAVVLTLNTGDLLTSAKSEKPDVIDLLESAFKYLAKSAPDFRAHCKDKKNNKNIVLRRNNTESVIFQVNVVNVLTSITSLIGTESFMKYADNMASMLRSLREEFNKGK